jgi:hypothetical protein
MFHGESQKGYELQERRDGCIYCLAGFCLYTFFTETFEVVSSCVSTACEHY